VKGAVPASHRIVIEPNRLAFDLDHALFDRLGESGADRSMVVISPDQVHISAANAIAIRSSFRQFSPAEIAEDPENVVLCHTRIDRIQQSGVVACHGFRRESQRPAWVAQYILALSVRQERALAIFDNVPMAEMRVGCEPDLHRRPRLKSWVEAIP